MARSYLASVFIVIPVDDVVTGIFNAPVAAIDFQNAVGIGLVWRLTGDAVNYFARDFPCLLLGPLAFDHEALADVGEIEIVIEFRRCPDSPNLDSSMPEIRTDSSRFAAVFKGEGEIFEELRLVAFDGEVIMGLPVFDQIAS